MKNKNETPHVLQGLLEGPVFQKNSFALNLQYCVTIFAFLYENICSNKKIPKNQSQH